MRTTLLGTSITYRPTTSQQYKISLTMESHLPSVRQKINADPMAEKTEHVNLLSEEEEKDPLALDTTIEQQSSRSKLSSSAKHSHSLRRHVPRIIVKPIPPEKKVTVTATTTLSSNVATSTATATANTVINATGGKNTTPSPSSRASSSRRAQQQAKAAAAAAAAAATATATGSAAIITPVTAITQASTMREVLASIPGFSLKPRRRSSKKISTAAQIEQTKDGKIDLETPDSILASTNLRDLLNKQTFSMLPPLYQYNLIQLLPSVDREAIEIERKNNADSTVTMEAIKLGPSSLNNEFFSRACLEWRERLAEGEFTPENQMKMKTEAEREKNKLDPWKLKHFEPIWGEKSYNRASSTSSNSSNISYSSGKSSDSYTNLIDERLEFKLESKGGLVATIVKTSTKSAAAAASTATSLAATTSATSTTTTTVTSATSADSTENTTSSSVDIKEEGEEFIDESMASTNVNSIKSEQELQLDELRQQEQTGSSTTDYEKQTDINCDVDNIGCTDSSSTFDLLRSDSSGIQTETPVEESKISLAIAALEHERQLIECGSSGNIRKRSESDITYENRTQSKQMKMEHQTEQQLQQQPEYDITDAATSIEQEVSHAIKDELKETLSPSVSSATSSSQELSGSNSLTTSSSATKMPTNDSFLYNSNFYNTEFEQQTNAALLLKETLMSTAGSEKTAAGNNITDISMKASNFLQNPETSFAAAITSVANSTCNSIATLLSGTSTFVNVNAVLPAVSPAPSLSSGITLQSFPTQGKQLHGCSIISIEDGEDDDEELIEQKFADAQNYVLESGEVSTDSSAGTNSALLTPGDVANIKEKKFIFCDSVDQGTTTQACDNLFENKQDIGSCISSVATSSASSSSSSSMTSAPTTSGDVMYAAAGQLPLTAPLTLEQKQQQQQQIILSLAEKSGEDLFHHVQHDWNFGGIKLQQTADATSNSFNGVIQTHQGVIKVKNMNTLSVEDAPMPSVDVTQDNEVVECMAVGGEEDTMAAQAAVVNCRAVDVIGEGVEHGEVDGDIRTEDVEDDDEAEEEDEDDNDDDADDNDAVRDIVDELQQQHRQLLKDQQQQQQQQQQLQHQQQLEEQQELREPEHRGHLTYEHSDYELDSDMVCDVQMSTNEMEVSSTVITNSNSDDSVNELHMGGSGNSRLDGNGVGNVTIQLSAHSPATIGHLHQQQQQQQAQHPQSQQPTTERQNTPQRQILLDTNGQIIGNFLVQHQQQQQQQHLEHQQQLLHHATQQFTFQTAQPQQQQTPTIALSTQQQQQQQHAQKSHHTLSTIRKAIELSTNGQHYLSPGGITAQQHIGQQLVLQQQAPQQRHFLTQPQVPTVSAATNCNMVTASPNQHQQQQQQQHQIHVQQQLQRFQQQQHQQQQQQQQQPTPPMPAFQSLAAQAQANPTKYISKPMNLITMSRGTSAGTVAGANSSIASVAIPPGSAVSTYPPFSSAIANSARNAAELIVNSTPNISNVSTSNVSVTNTNAIKGLTPAGIPTTIAQQRPANKLPTGGKGRKTVNKLPPGAVNLERSYQICQAVIQNSPNRENLKAQLRPPSAILNQHQQQPQQQQQQQLTQSNIATTMTLQGTVPASSVAASTAAISVATSSPAATCGSSSQNFIKQEDLTSIPANIMGVGRPGVYKVIGPRMGFPRKKYVQRKPSPTLIRHLFTPQTANALHTNVTANPRLQQQLTAAAAVQQQQQPHDLHQNSNGGGQYVLVHRANVGAADNQAPRASSAPPVPQTTQIPYCFL
ncbi:polycomb protein Asx isoform X2 [Bactrocera neohumeralis]|uniref:polycomb protein Asx isoform X2 n=1 Tax=Bactrocera neohumeralis TaxID=98809 RepID=UPI00216534B4|nr:polycomb protein Asx isoform X2 [Bactrocera neohumeralis]